MFFACGTSNFMWYHTCQKLAIAIGPFWTPRVQSQGPLLGREGGRGALRPGVGRVGTTIGRGAGEGFPCRLAWSIRRGKPGCFRAMVGNNGVRAPANGWGKGIPHHWKGEVPEFKKYFGFRSVQVTITIFVSSQIFFI